MLRAVDARTGRARSMPALPLGTAGDLHWRRKSRELWEQNSALSILGNIGPEAKAAVPVLIDALDDKEPSVRQYALSALVSIGPEARAAAPVLMETLTKIQQDKDSWRHRGDIENILNALAKMGPATFMEVLKNAALREQTATIYRPGGSFGNSLSGGASMVPESDSVPAMILRLMGPEAKATVHS